MTRYFSTGNQLALDDHFTRGAFGEMAIHVDPPQSPLFDLGLRMGVERRHQFLIVEKAEITIDGDQIVADEKSVLRFDMTDHRLDSFEKFLAIFDAIKRASREVGHKRDSLLTINIVG